MTPLTCTNCNTTYTKLEARSITVKGPETAEYACPKCHQTITAAPPQAERRHDLPGIDHIEQIHEDGERLAVCWFENNSQLRFRETEAGWLREEVVFPEGRVHESRAIGRIDPDDGKTACHCLVERLDSYEKNPLSTIRVNWPHIASVVLVT